MWHRGEAGAPWKPSVPIAAISGHRLQANWFPPLQGVGEHEPLYALWMEALGLSGLCRDELPSPLFPGSSDGVDRPWEGQTGFDPGLFQQEDAGWL